MPRRAGRSRADEGLFVYRPVTRPARAAAMASSTTVPFGVRLAVTVEVWTGEWVADRPAGDQRASISGRWRGEAARIVAARTVTPWISQRRWHRR